MRADRSADATRSTRRESKPACRCSASISTTDNLPQEVGRDREAISFTKGCYLGQETVARIDALGHVNQRIVGVRFFGSDVPAVGARSLSHGGRGRRPRDVGGVFAAARRAAGAGDGAARGERGRHAAGIAGRRMRSGRVAA